MCTFFSSQVVGRQVDRLLTAKEKDGGKTHDLEVMRQFENFLSGGFLLSAAEQFLKHELTKNFKVC